MVEFKKSVIGSNSPEFSSASLLPCCVINHNMIIVKVCFFFTVFLVLENVVALPSHFFRGKQIPDPLSRRANHNHSVF